MSSHSNRKIAIIGAGPGGLTLAALLKTKSIPVTIYERETAMTARSQGGTLDLHGSGGQLALQEAGLIEEFKKYARYDGEDFKMTTSDLQLLIDEVAEDKGESFRPEIDRIQLREILLNAVGTSNITWGKHVTSVQPSAEENGNKFEVHFKDGSVDGPFDLVVGADGAWCKVRPLVTDVKPFYSGVSAVSLTHLPVSVTNARHANFANLVRRGSAMGFKKGKGIQALRLGDTSIKVYCSFKVADENWIKRFDNPDDFAKVRADLLQEFSDWHPDWKDAIELSDDDKDTYMAKPLYMLPVGHKWDQRKGVTLVGDAAHLFTPYAGEGVNMAMVDSLELSKAIVKGINGNDEDFYAAIRGYELEMFDRAKVAAQSTKENMEMMHANDYPESAKAMIALMTGGGPPPSDGREQ